jgi:C_GCAxxG_C_C family probable redox protein
MINIEERVTKAKRLFKEEGYNCCQAVVLAYNDIFGVDDDTAAALSSGFGGGMGRMREVCGAVSGMFIVADLLCGYTSPTDDENKKKTYAMIQKLAEDFREQNGSIICRELLGLDKPEGTHIPEKRTDQYYKKRPCSEICRIAADIAEKYFVENKIL